MGAGEPIISAIRYIITVVALVFLLLLAAAAMLKEGTRSLPGLGGIPNIMAPERR
jgi:hypothetical protein